MPYPPRSLSGGEWGHGLAIDGFLRLGAMDVQLVALIRGLDPNASTYKLLSVKNL